jgi:hypothetical protein
MQYTYALIVTSPAASVLAGAYKIPCRETLPGSLEKLSQENWGIERGCRRSRAVNFQIAQAASAIKSHSQDASRHPYIFQSCYRPVRAHWRVRELSIQSSSRSLSSPFELGVRLGRGGARGGVGAGCTTALGSDGVGSTDSPMPIAVAMTAMATISQKVLVRSSAPPMMANVSSTETRRMRSM